MLIGISAFLSKMESTIFRMTIYLHSRISLRILPLADHPGSPNQLCNFFQRGRADSCWSEMYQVPECSLSLPTDTFLALMHLKTPPRHIWLYCMLTQMAPRNDLYFIKSMKSYIRIKMAVLWRLLFITRWIFIKNGEDHRQLVQLWKESRGL